MSALCRRVANLWPSNGSHVVRLSCAALVTNNNHARHMHTSDHLGNYYHGKWLDPHANLPKALQMRDDSQRHKISPEERLRRDMQLYERSREWLANMMGEDPDTFGQEDIDRAISYLLPSPLYATDTRPKLNDPMEVYRKMLGNVRKFEGATNRPTEAGYYSGTPTFVDLAYKAWEMLEELRQAEMAGPPPLPTSTTSEPTEQADSGDWMTYQRFKMKINENIKEKHHEELFNRFKLIAASPYLTDDMQEFLADFRLGWSQQDPYAPLKDTELVDGEARAMGYRKTATADVFVTHGTGKLLVNDQNHADYFRLRSDLEQLAHPFLITGTFGKFDVKAYIIGGGTSGQAGAVRMGVSCAMAMLCPDLRPLLQKADLLERDVRSRERKKPGRAKARKRYAWRRR